MAYTFLKAKGYEIGKSLVDDTKIDYCKEMMEKAEKQSKKLLLPVDSVTIADFPNPIDAPVEVQVYDVTNMPADREGCDIGPKTAALYAEAVKTAKTVVWNGPMGVFENPVLKKGTVAVFEALAAADATTIIGGGASASADVYLDKARAHHKQYALSASRETPIKVASLGNDAGIIGAAYVALRAAGK